MEFDPGGPPLHQPFKGLTCSGLFLGPGRPSAGGASGEMRIHAPWFSVRFQPPNPPFQSLVSVCAEVAPRTTPRIHAGLRGGDLR